MREKKHREEDSQEGIDAEDEAPLASVGQTLIVVPTDLLPAIRELIANHRRAGSADPSGEG